MDNGLAWEPEGFAATSFDLPVSMAAVKAVRKVQKNLLISYLADMAKHSGKQKSVHLVLKIVAETEGLQAGMTKFGTFYDAITVACPVRKSRVSRSGYAPKARNNLILVG